MKRLFNCVIAFISVFNISSGFAQTWLQTQTDVAAFPSFVCSADASKLIGAGSSQVYVSTNFGVNWIPTTPQPNAYFHVACSADGTKLAAVGVNLRTSADSGATWTVQASIQNAFSWNSIASSADGINLAACGYGFVYTSTNSGINWITNNLPAHNWQAIASSADGGKLTVVMGYNESGVIYVSTNSGSIWTQTQSPAISWYSIASSADGNRLIAGAHGGGVFLSTNGGMSWTSNSLPNADWNSVASSADGNALIAANDQGWLYASTNSGMDWISTSSIYPFWGAASSADGKKLFSMTTIATPTGWYYAVCSLQSAPSLQMDIVNSNSDLTISWLIPSTKLVLQQTSDLNAPDWTKLSNQPKFNLTNLKNQVTLHSTNRSAFFRLMAQ